MQRRPTTKQRWSPLRRMSVSVSIWRRLPYCLTASAGHRVWKRDQLPDHPPRCWRRATWSCPTWTWWWRSSMPCCLSGRRFQRYRLQHPEIHHLQRARDRPVRISPIHKRRILLRCVADDGCSYPLYHGQQEIGLAIGELPVSWDYIPSMYRGYPSCWNTVTISARVLSWECTLYG